MLVLNSKLDVRQLVQAVESSKDTNVNGGEICGGPNSQGQGFEETEMIECQLELRGQGSQTTCLSATLNLTTESLETQALGTQIIDLS